MHHSNICHQYVLVTRCSRYAKPDTCYIWAAQVLYMTHVFEEQRLLEINPCQRYGSTTLFTILSTWGDT